MFKIAIKWEELQEKGMQMTATLTSELARKGVVRDNEREVLI